MSPAGFYELLTAHFADRRPLESVPERQHLAQSIADHVERLLNSRQGALRVAPEYGLPDTNLIYANQPAARELLRAAIAQTIIRHEPRVVSVRVTSKARASADFVHGYHISCLLRRSGSKFELEGWVREDGRLHMQARGPDANSWAEATTL